MSKIITLSAVSVRGAVVVSGAPLLDREQAAAKAAQGFVVVTGEQTAQGLLIDCVSVTNAITALENGRSTQVLTLKKLADGTRGRVALPLASADDIAEALTGIAAGKLQSVSVDLTPTADTPATDTVVANIVDPAIAAALAAGQGFTPVARAA